MLKQYVADKSIKVNKKTQVFPSSFVAEVVKVNPSIRQYCLGKNQSFASDCKGYYEFIAGLFGEDTTAGKVRNFIKRLELKETSSALMAKISQYMQSFRDILPSNIVPNDQKEATTVQNAANDDAMDIDQAGASEDSGKTGTRKIIKNDKSSAD
jgi:hypothetical protein